MPYKIVKRGKCFRVVNKRSGRVHSKCTSKKKASRQLRLLYGIESGWKPSKQRRRKRSYR